MEVLPYLGLAGGAHVSWFRWLRNLRQLVVYCANDFHSISFHRGDILQQGSIEYVAWPQLQGREDRPASRDRPTPTSRPVLMISRNFCLQARPWQAALLSSSCFPRFLAGMWGGPTDAPWNSTNHPRRFSCRTSCRRARRWRVSPIWESGRIRMIWNSWPSMASRGVMPAGRGGSAA